MALNKTYIRTDRSPKHITHEVNVTEKKVPTDESLKLLNECKQKAKEEIMSEVDLKDNVVNGIAVSAMKGISMFDQVEFYFKFTLNGKDFIHKRKLDHTKSMGYIELNNISQWKQLAQDLSEVVAHEITIMIFDSREFKEAVSRTK